MGNIYEIPRPRNAPPARNPPPPGLEAALDHRARRAELERAATRREREFLVGFGLGVAVGVAGVLWVAAIV